MAASTRLPSGELVSQVGADVDELANVLVRAIVRHGRRSGLVIDSNCCCRSYFTADRCGTGDLPTNHRCCGAVACWQCRCGRSKLLLSNIIPNAIRWLRLRSNMHRNFAPQVHCQLSSPNHNASNSLVCRPRRYDQASHSRCDNTNRSDRGQCTRRCDSRDRDSPNRRATTLDVLILLPL